MTTQNSYVMNEDDWVLTRSAADLLNKLMQAPWVHPAQRVTLAKLQHVLAKLPRVSELDFINLSLSGPQKFFGDIKVFDWWEIEVSDGELKIQNGGYFHRPSSGGDTFTATSWFISHENESDYDDFLENLRIVPDAAAFPESVERIDLSAGGYSLTLTDEANTLLEEMEDDESEEDEECEDEDSDEDEDDDDSENEFEPFELLPVDDDERELAKLVFVDEVAAHETEYGYGAKTCGLCDCDLSKRGFYVDGKLRGQAMWANFCIPCLRRGGEGIGWGMGQLYARQSDGKWRLVAGFAP